MRAELQARGDFAIKAIPLLDPLLSFDLGAVEQWVQRLGRLGDGRSSRTRSRQSFRLKDIRQQHVYLIFVFAGRLRQSRRAPLG